MPVLRRHRLDHRLDRLVRRLRPAVRSAAAAGRVRAGFLSAARSAGGRDRRGAAGAAGYRRRQRSGDCTAPAAHCYRRSRLVARADWNSIPCPEQAMVPAREWEVLVMSCHRAHRVSALRLVVVSRNPLAPDTDLHHRTIRECLVDYRTDGASGRDEKDVGVRSCSCGVAEKKSATSNGSRGPRGKLTRNPEPYSVWKVARLPGLRSCKNGTIAWCKCPATSEWYGTTRGKSSGISAASRFSRCLYSYKTEAGSCELCSYPAG